MVAFAKAKYFKCFLKRGSACSAVAGADNQNHGPSERFDRRLRQPYIASDAIINYYSRLQQLLALHES